MTSTELMTEGLIAAKVAQLGEVREEMKELRKAETNLSAQIKQHLALNDLMEFDEGETWIARIRSTRNHTYDLPSFVKHEEKAGEWLVEAVLAGVIKVDHAALSTWIRNTGGAIWAAGLMRYHDEAGANESLYVERR